MTGQLIQQKWKFQPPYYTMRFHWALHPYPCVQNLNHPHSLCQVLCGHRSPVSIQLYGRTLDVGRLNALLQLRFQSRRGDHFVAHRCPCTSSRVQRTSAPASVAKSWSIVNIFVVCRVTRTGGRGVRDLGCQPCNCNYISISGTIIHNRIIHNTYIIRIIHNTEVTLLVFANPGHVI